MYIEIRKGGFPFDARKTEPIAVTKSKEIIGGLVRLIKSDI
tara:strand:+ start:4215 stop:4337 length:123 start_codon:yes stop_codon:yes gene_type:complete